MKISSRQRRSADPKCKEEEPVRDGETGVSWWTRVLYRWCLVTVAKKKLEQEFLKLES